MIKNKPEVGDIWRFRDSDLIFVIICIIEYGKGIQETYQCLWEEGVFFRISDTGKDIFKECEYLGKSKANINEIFEVEEC